MLGQGLDGWEEALPQKLLGGLKLSSVVSAVSLGPVEFADIVLDSHATSFSQDGWYLSFSDYSLTPIGYLPGKITGQSDQLSFKLIVSKWRNPNN